MQLELDGCTLGMRIKKCRSNLIANYPQDCDSSRPALIKRKSLRVKQAQVAHLDFGNDEQGHERQGHVRRR